ncbi:DUF4252 domain-containing protein [Chryseobacterium sp. G0240]|uniref:DUF4252 domain-containing protein n=1 Tax=Chryseobacterium sp. G0240 TaxID=2487066 RepID=UPI000F44C2A8|nr:DUF4252 domain-containing protein [Chryseobacterium sp. G0240]ROI01006.1 DUF4252 domain-containing protein [Chryseobacterium sp. G0240]
MKTLRHISLALFTIGMLQSCMVSGKPNMEFFSDSGYDFKGAKMTSFNVPVFLAKPYIKRALREDGESEEVISLVKKVSKIKILTIENGSREMLKDYTQYLNNHDYEDWATIKHDGENVNVRVKQNGDAIKNMLFTVNSDKEMVFVDVKGNFTAEDISKMINSVSNK